MAKDNEELKSLLSELQKDMRQMEKTLTEQALLFDHHTKQDESMYAELKRMNDILQDNTQSLKEHMYRTNLLEEALVKMDERLSPIEIERIKKQAVNSWLKDNAILIGKIFAGIGALYGAWKAIVAILQ